MAKQTIDAAAILALVQADPNLLKALRSVVGNGSDKAVEVKRAVGKNGERYNGVNVTGNFKPCYVPKQVVEHILANGPTVMKLFD